MLGKTLREKFMNLSIYLSLQLKRRPVVWAVLLAALLGVMLGVHGAVTAAAASATNAGKDTKGEEPPFSGPRLELPPQTVAPGKVHLTIQVNLPPGYKPTQESPSQATVSTAHSQVLSLGPEASRNINPAQFPLKLPLTAHPGETRLTLDLLLYYCKTNNGGLCLFKEVRLILPVRVTPDAPSRRLEAAYRLVGP